jgi:hypothetical protein
MTEESQSLASYVDGLPSKKQVGSATRVYGGWKKRCTLTKELEMKQSLFIHKAAFCLCLLLVAAPGYAQDTDYTPMVGQAGKDVMWVPTPETLVDTMLNMAKVTASDYVIDLGSGDGRLVISAAKRGATALGIEYNPEMVELARRTAKEEGVSAKATFKKADIFESDFSKATVITMFLLQSLNLRLRPEILNMKPGTRIVSNSFDMGEWEPDQTTVLENAVPDYASSGQTAYLWIVPAKVDGIWKLANGQIRFVQNYQNITGTLTIKEKTTELTGKLNGGKIRFNVGDVEYVGTVSGNTISGTYSGGVSWKATR